MHGRLDQEENMGIDSSCSRATTSYKCYSNIFLKKMGKKCKLCKEKGKTGNFLISGQTNLIQTDYTVRKKHMEYHIGICV